MHRYHVIVYGLTPEGQRINVGECELEAPNRMEAQQKALDQLWDERLTAADCIGVAVATHLPEEE